MTSSLESEILLPELVYKLLSQLNPPYSFNMNSNSVILSILLIGSFVVHSVDSHIYGVTVSTGHGFLATKGLLYVTLQSSTGASTNASMGNVMTINPNWNYIRIVDSPIPATQLTSVVFQWINRSNDSAASIILGSPSVTVIPSYLQDPFRTQFTKRFCADGNIPSGSPGPLAPC